MRKSALSSRCFADPCDCELVLKPPPRALKPGIGIVGSATFFIGKDPATCEFATTVAGDYGGQGLGNALVSALIRAAKRRGLREMEGFVLAQNQPMLRLAARLGFSISADPDDPGVRICRLRLADS